MYICVSKCSVLRIKPDVMYSSRSETPLCFIFTTCLMDNKPHLEVFF